jgi:DNA uptake protein ComE-like DNA-binding protein
MAPPRRDSTGDAIGSETAEWLAVPGASQAPAREPSEAENWTPENAGQAASPGEPQSQNSRAELETAERKIEEQRLEIERLRDQVARLERELQERKTASSAPPAMSPRTALRTSDSSEPVDLNEAFFEDLRAIGLSVADSARVIAYRDLRAGFGSMDELPDLPGLSPDAVDRLMDGTRISS